MAPQLRPFGNPIPGRLADGALYDSLQGDADNTNKGNNDRVDLDSIRWFRHDFVVVLLEEENYATCCSGTDDSVPALLLPPRDRRELPSVMAPRSACHPCLLYFQFLLWVQGDLVKGLRYSFGRLGSVTACEC